MINLEKAKELLVQKEYTCVLCKEDEVFQSKKRGVAPLMEFLESGKSFLGFFAADRTVGAGAAHLYVLLGVKAVWTRVISEDAEKILKASSIDVYYETLVPYIINRTGDGRCPVETCVQGISDSAEAAKKIKELLPRLN